MTEQQKRAEREERAQMVCSMLRDDADMLSEVMMEMSQARRAYDSIVMGGNNTHEVVHALCEHIAAAGAILDDLLGDMWEVLEPEDTEELLEDLQAQQRANRLPMPVESGGDHG